MNKLFTKIATLSVGLAMAIGVGVAVGGREAKAVSAADVTAASWSRSGTTDSATGGTFSTTANGKSGYYQDQGTAGTTNNYVQVLNQTAYWSSAPTSVKVSVKLGCGSTNESMSNPVYAVLLDSSGNEISSSKTSITTSLTSTTDAQFNNVAIPAPASAYGVRISHVKEQKGSQGWNVRYYSFSLVYDGEAGTSYTVQYNPGTGASGTITSSTGSSVTLKTWADISSSVTRPSGKWLSGWNTNADGTGTPYTSGQTGVQADLILYAQWAEPLTVAQARTKVDGGTGLTEQFVKGIVSSIPYAYSSTNKNITFNLSDDGKTSSNQFQAYKCASDSDPDVKVGDVITVYGTLTVYNSTYEFTQGNKIVHHSKITGLNVTTAPTKTTYNSGEQLSVAGLVVSATYDNGESSHSFSYADYSSGFIFSPDNGDELSTSDTTLTIGYGHGSTTQTLTVNAAPAVLSVSVSPESKSLGFDEEFTITATVAAEGGASQNVNWSIEDSSTLVSIKSSTTSQAVIKANSSTKGTAVVTATSAFDGTKKASCTIKVVNPDDLTDTLTYELIGVTGTSYSPWSGVSDATAAVYAGTTAGGNSAIQFNATSGYIRNTASAGYVRNVDFTVNSNTGTSRTIYLYGSSTAFESKSDVSSGTPLGTAIYDGTSESLSIAVAAQYELEYFGIVISGGAVWLDEIVITYEKIDTNPSISILGNTSLTGKEGSSDSTSTSVKVKNIESPVFTFTYDEDEKTEQATSSYVSVSQGTPTDGIYPLTINFNNPGSTVVNIDVSGQKATISVTVVEVSYISATLSAQYRQVFDVSSLTAGDQIIIADNNSDDTKDKYMNSTLTSGYFGATAATFTNSYLSSSAVASAVVLTLGGNESDGWTLKNSSNKYLVANSSSSFVLSDDEGTWNIAISSGNAEITYSSYGHILHNVQSGRFKPYTSAPNVSMRYPQIYRYVSGEKEVEIGTNLLTAISSAESAFTCNDQGTSFDASSFNSMSSYFSAALINEYYLDAADSLETKLGGNAVENFLARYDYVLAKKEAGFEAYASANDFLGRISSGKIQSSGRIAISDIVLGNNATLIIVVASIVSLTAIGGYFLFKKKKQN